MSSPSIIRMRSVKLPVLYEQRLVMTG